MRSCDKINTGVDSLVESRWYYLFLSIVSFAFVLLFSRATSPLYAYAGYDAAIFKQMGMAILKGKTIYLDYFDNKGCLLYFLHALCLWLGGDFVILIFQTISLIVSLIFLDKIISLYKNGASRFYVLVLGLVLLLCFYEGGDLSEEWSLPFICYPLYKFLKSSKYDKPLNAKDLYLIGLCFGVIAFLRINNAVPFCGFLVCLFWRYIVNKQWSDLVVKMLSFLGGILSIALPCFLYFYLKAGLEGVDWMVYGTFISGFDYLGVKMNSPIVVTALYYLTVLLFFSLYVTSLDKSKTPIIISYILFLLSFGTKCLEHYQIIMVPLYVLSISLFDIKKHSVKILFVSITASCILAFLVRPVGFLAIELSGKDKFEKAYVSFHEKISQMPFDERDSIYNYNVVSSVGAGLLMNEGLIQSNKVLYPYLSFWLERFKKERRLLEEEKPLWVMISHNMVVPEDMVYLKNNYTECFVYHYDTRYLKNYNGFGVETDIYFFRKKE